MEKDIIRYDFPYGITKEMWRTISQKLALLYPGIEWISGTNVHEYFFSPDWVLYIYVILNEDGFRLSYSNMAYDEDDYTGKTADGLDSLYINYDETGDLFGQINESDDGLDWARESLEDITLTPSIDYNRMTVWVFTSGTINPGLKAELILNSLKEFGFDISESRIEYYINDIILALKEDPDYKPYIRTSNNTGTYRGISCGTNEEVFIEVVSKLGFDDPNIDVIYV